MPRRSQTQSIVPAPSRADDLLLPTCGPNALAPEKMTVRERREEITAILARGFLRRLHGIPPFANSPPTNN